MQIFLYFFQLLITSVFFDFLKSFNTSLFFNFLKWSPLKRKSPKFIESQRRSILCLKNPCRKLRFLAINFFNTCHYWFLLWLHKLLFHRGAGHPGENFCPFVIQSAEDTNRKRRSKNLIALSEFFAKRGVPA